MLSPFGDGTFFRIVSVLENTKLVGFCAAAVSTDFLTSRTILAFPARRLILCDQGSED